MNRAELKVKAKESLKGHWGNMILLILIPGIVSGVYGGIIGANSTDGVYHGSMTIMMILYLAVIIFSVYMDAVLTFYSLKVSRNESVTLKEAFSRKDLIIPFLVVGILVAIFTFLWSCLLIIPGIIAAFSYSMYKYIRIDYPELSATDVIKKSKEMMKGHKWELFVLGLSFILWILLASITVIAILYVAPYMYITMCNFYNKLKEQTN